MSTQDLAVDTARKDSAFESTAREIAEFVVSVAILPVALLFVKPATIIRGAETGNYRPLPSPFLLALVTGIALSGVALNAQALVENADSAIGEIMRWYGNMNNGVLAILAAIPYLCFVWIVAGGLSLAMLRGSRSAEPLWATVSFGFAAHVMVSGIAITTAYSLGAAAAYASDGVTPILVIASIVLAYTLILAIKVIRLLFAVRHEHGSPLIGAFIGAVAALVIIGSIGVGGAAAAGALYFDNALRAENTYREAQQNFDGVIQQYNQQIEANPDNPYPWNERCWARATMRRQLEEALVDCNTSLSLMPETDPAVPNVLDSRGLVYLGLARYGAAFADYDRAVELYESADAETRRWQTPASFYYGRGLARLGLGQGDDGRADIARAQSLDASTAASYESYGFRPDMLNPKDGGAVPVEAAPAAE